MKEDNAYRVVKAPHEPLIPVELFELTLSIRQEKAQVSPNRVGKPHSYGQNRCGRFDVLQGLLLCGDCGHAMAPHYTYHKPGKERKQESYIHFYVCAAQIKASQEFKHKNRVQARLAESWALETVQEVIESKAVLECAVQHARAHSEQVIKPQREGLELNSASFLRSGKTRYWKMSY